MRKQKNHAGRHDQSRRRAALPLVDGWPMPSIGRSTPLGSIHLVRWGFVGFRWVSTGFYESSPCYQRDFTQFYWVSMDWNRLKRVKEGFHGFQLGLSRVYMGGIRLNWFQMGLFGFREFSMGFHGLNREYFGFLWVLLGITGYYWVFQSFSG